MTAPHPHTSPLEPARGAGLPLSVRPVRCDLHLTLDLAQQRFTGRVLLELALDRGTSELWLHAAGLAVTRALATPRGAAPLAGQHALDEEHERLRLRFADAVPAGAAGLELTFAGPLARGRGLLRAGHTGLLAAGEARRLFPCFDEPCLRARHRLVVSGVPAGSTVVSNARVVQDCVLPGAQRGERRVTFAETEPIASSGLVLCLGPAAQPGGRPASQVVVRDCSTRPAPRWSAFAQEAAEALLPLIARAAGAPPPEGKLDLVAVPELLAARGGAGCLLLPEAVLVCDEVTSTRDEQARAAGGLARSLAHLWTDGRVAAEASGEGWLAEALPAFLAAKALAGWQPDDPAFVESAALPDDRSSARGLRLLEMLEELTGAAVLREQVQRFLALGAGRPVPARKLWRALGQASRQPVQELIEGWEAEPDPLLIEVGESRGRLWLRQRPLPLEPGARHEGARHPRPRVCPVRLRLADQGGLQQQALVLSAAEQEAPPGSAGSMRAWVVVDATPGLVRVAYAPELHASLLGAQADLTAAERRSLLRDRWALLRGGLCGPVEVLSLLCAQGGDRDPAVLREVVAQLSWLERKGVADGDRRLLRAVAARSLAAQGAALGWQERPGEDARTLARRAAVLEGLALVSREPLAVEAALERFEVLVRREAVSPGVELHALVLAAGARCAGRASFDALRTKAFAEARPARRRRLLLALAQVEAPELVEEAAALLLSEQLPVQELAPLFAALLRNRSTCDAALALCRTRWPLLHLKASSARPAVPLAASLSAVTTRAQLEEVERLVARGGLGEAAADALERLRRAVALRERCVPLLEAHLRRSTAGPVAAGTRRASPTTAGEGTGNIRPAAR